MVVGGGVVVGGGELLGGGVVDGPAAIPMVTVDPCASNLPPVGVSLYTVPGA